MLVLDVDDGTPPEDLLKPFADWPYAWHTSWSHTPGHPKFRVIIPLEVPVPAAGWPRVFHWAHRVTGGHIDPKCKDASRIWFRPSVRSADWPFAHGSHDPGGNLLCLLPDRLDPTPDEVEAERIMRLRSRPPIKHAAGTPEWKVRRAAQDRLKTDHSAREQACIAAGGRLAGNRATKIPCPGCGRQSVWYYIEPRKSPQAQCDHRNSCGWYGFLDLIPGVLG